jgi:hypothetical protein
MHIKGFLRIHETKHRMINFGKCLKIIIKFYLVLLEDLTLPRASSHSALH